MFPHQKLDWNLRRLEKLLKSSPDDAEVRLELGTLELSKAWFHDGGESWFNKALHNGKHVLSGHRNDHRRLHIDPRRRRNPPGVGTTSRVIAHRLADGQRVTATKAPA